MRHFCLLPNEMLFFLPPFLEHYVDISLRDVVSSLTTITIMSRALEILKAHLSLLQ